MSKLILLLVFVGTLLYSIGATAQYYFYSDDYSVLYNIQRRVPLGWPYDGEYYAIFKPLYALFRLQPGYYFALGVLTYALAALSVYLFFRTVTRKSLVAYFCSLVFATGYVGIAQYNMFVTSLPNNLSIIGICIVLNAYYRWITSKRLRFYVLTLFLFYVLLRLFPFRVFTLVLFLPTLEVLFRSISKPFRIKNIVLSAVCLMPFYAVAKYAGVFGYGDNNLAKAISYLQPAMAAQFLAIFGRMILPNPILLKFGLEATPQIHAAVGIGFFVFSILVAGVVWCSKKYQQIGVYLLLALGITLEGYAGNFLLMPSFGDSGAVSRYLPISFIGFSAFFPLLFWTLGVVLRKEKSWWYRCFCFSLLLLYICAFAVSSREYVLPRIKDGSIPAAKFISQLKFFIPSFPPHAAIYMDSSEYYPAIPRLGNILSNASYTYEVTFAVLYNLPMSGIRFTLSLDDYIQWHEQPKNPDEKFYSFYYDGINLRNTTNEVERSLRSDEIRVIPISTSTAVLTDPNKVFSMNISRIPGFGKQELELTLKLSALSPSSFTYPYYFGDPSETQKKEIRKTYDANPVDRGEVFQYSIARHQYYQTVQASGSLSHLLYPQKFLVDNRFDTWWLDAEHLWQLKPQYKQFFVIDLAIEKFISRILWIPVNGRVASVYKISASSDSVFWQPLPVRSSNIAYGENVLVNDTFPPVWARYIKYEIAETQNGETPSMRELEVVEDAYRSIDPIIAWRIGNAPFEYIKNQEELNQSYEYIREHGVASIFTRTNKEDVLDNQRFVYLPLYVDGQIHTYTIPIPSRGTSLEQIGIKASYPIKVDVEGVRVLQRKVLE